LAVTVLLPPTVVVLLVVPEGVVRIDAPLALHPASSTIHEVDATVEILGYVMYDCEMVFAEALLPNGLIALTPR